MEKKDFILILVVIIILSGGYYLYTAGPFGKNNIGLPTEAATQIYAISGVAKEVYDTVIILETIKPKEEGGLGELIAVINDGTSIFRYGEVNEDGSVEQIELSIQDIEVGDRIALTSDSDIKDKNGVFLTSSIAVYK